MADTCYLCTIGPRYQPLPDRAAGEGFGTCHECWVHACPKHGERSSQFFRCSDCIAARAANSGVTGTRVVSDIDPEVLAPRLTALSAWVRDGFDSDRMSDAIRWVRRRIAAQQPLSLAVDLSGGYTEIAPAELLGLDAEDVGEAAIMPATFHAQALEAQVEAAVLAAEPPEDDVGSAVALTTLGMAIAYDARGVEDPTRSPLAFRGGLTLPASVVVLGHAYARGYDLFQATERAVDEEELGMGTDA